MKFKRKRSAQNNDQTNGINKKKLKRDQRKPSTVAELNELTNNTNPAKYFNKITLINDECIEICKKNTITIKLKKEIDEWLVKFNKLLIVKFQTIDDQGNDDDDDDDVKHTTTKKSSSKPASTSSSKQQKNNKKSDVVITNENIQEWIAVQEKKHSLKFARNFHKEYNLTKYFIKFIKPIGFTTDADQHPLLVTPIGSYKYGTILKYPTIKEIQIDLRFELPNGYLQKDNYLNLIYHQKLIVYLFELIKLLLKNTDDEELDGDDPTADENEKLYNCLRYRYNQMDDKLKPILEITPNPKLFTATKKPIRFLLHLFCNSNTFKLNRFIPETNNIRPIIFKHNVEETKPSVTLPSTPQYNSSILSDLTQSQMDTQIDKFFKELSSDEMIKIKNVIILLKMWLNNLKLNQSICGFNGFILTAFIIYLYKMKKIQITLDYFKLLQIIWYNLANSKWNESGITLFNGVATDTKQYPNLPELNEFHKYYDIVFIDSTGYYNLCSKLSLDIYLRVRFESERALKILNQSTIEIETDSDELNERKSTAIADNTDGGDDSNFMINRKSINGLENFHNLFIKSTINLLQYDYCFTVTTRTLSFTKEYGTEMDQLNYAGNYLLIGRQLISKLLRKGLTNRCLTMTPIFNDSYYTDTVWDVTEKSPHFGKFPIKFGFHWHPENAFNILDKGPIANQQPFANEFRQFWGNKSELRRFPTGEITESCVWATQSSTLCERRLICSNIIKHLLQLHFNLNVNNDNDNEDPANYDHNFQYQCNELDFAYTIDIDKIQKYKFKDLIAIEFDDSYTNIESMTLQIIKEFNELSKLIRNLTTDLPLQIVSCSGQSSIFRYCDIRTSNAILKSILKKHTSNEQFLIHSNYPIDCVLQFESSGKWPDDLKAINHLKTALLLKLHERMLEANSNNNNNEGGDGKDDKDKKLYIKCYRNFMDCIKSGYLFRFHIAPVAKELQLMKRQITTNGVVKYRDTVESLQIEKSMFILPKLTIALHGLYQKYTSFGPTVLIAKRWLNAQLIDNYLFPDTCIELLIASQYLNLTDEYTTIPFQPQLGFLRFLNLLANTNWDNKLILLNFNQLLSDVECTKIETQFFSNRKQFSKLCIITAFDIQKTGQTWTVNQQPQSELLLHLSKLASRSLNVIDEGVNQFGHISKQILECIFTPVISGYNFIIKLNTMYKLPFFLKDVHQSKGNLNLKSKSSQLVNLPQLVNLNVIDLYLNELRMAYEKYAIFFYDSLNGNEIYGLWKPNPVVENNTQIIDPDTDDKTIDDNIENLICTKLTTTDKNVQINYEQIIKDFSIIGKGLVCEVTTL